jgi:uncharacterized membrane-anchored protein
MNTKITLALLALVAAAQIAVPAGIAFQQEAALHWGRSIKVAVQPVDPSQPFMGKYVALQFSDLRIHDESGKFQNGERVYVALEDDANGFAHAKALLTEPPEDQAYIPALIGGTSGGQAVYSFNRFYLLEENAPQVERRLAARRTVAGVNLQSRTINAYVTVRVWKNTATLEQLYIDNMPVDEYLRGQAAPQAGKTPKP